MTTLDQAADRIAAYQDYLRTRTTMNFGRLENAINDLDMARGDYSKTPPIEGPVQVSVNLDLMRELTRLARNVAEDYVDVVGNKRPVNASGYRRQQRELAEAHQLQAIIAELTQTTLPAQPEDNAAATADLKPEPRSRS